MSQAVSCKIRHLCRFVAAIFLLACFGRAADAVWEFGRIVDVKKSVNSRTRVWVANTPIYEDLSACTIAVHLGNQVVTGIHELSEKEAPPPDEWTPQYPVQVQVQGDTMYVRGPTGQMRLRVIRRKPASPMLPLSAEEKKNLTARDSTPPQESMIGFSKETKSSEKPTSSPPPAQVSSPAPTPPPGIGAITVRSTPFLSEVFVDGESMGYTPAKINLPPGKHTFRVEKSGYKPWTKELTLTVESELTLDASLDKK